MKWFKHFSDASDDEEIALLVSEFGGDGYMYYWRILETIASQMKTENPKTYLVYAWEKWAKCCGLSQQKFRKISNFVSTLSILFLEKSEKTLKIDCPKLLEIKDNHFKNLQVTGNKLAPRSRSRSREKKEPKKEVCVFPDSSQKNTPVFTCSEISPAEIFESRFSETFQTVIEIWKKERNAVGMSEYVAKKDRYGAEQITIAIDGGELSLSDFCQAVKNLMADPVMRQKYTLEGMFNNLGNWINRQPDKPIIKPGERAVNQPTNVKFVEGKCGKCGKDSTTAPNSQPFTAVCRFCGAEFEVK